MPAPRSGGGVKPPQGNSRSLSGTRLWCDSLGRAVKKYLTPTLIGGIGATGALIALVVVLWPPTLVAGVLLGILGVLLTLALVAHVWSRRRYRDFLNFDPNEVAGLSEIELAEWRQRQLLEHEQRLERRELQLARQTRALQIVNPDYLDVLDTEPSAEELGALVDKDRELLALIDSESQLAFERLRENRYATDDRVDTLLIFADLRDFVERVARLYRPGTERPLLETEIELIAKSLSSTALHLLVVVDGLPIDLKSYNIAKIYRLIRRGATYYGTYKKFRPYVEHGLNVLQMARVALGINPAIAGAT